MKNEVVKCVGVSYNISVPETAEEYDQLAGKVGACVSSANRNVIYRQTNPQFRPKFCELVEEDTGIERKTKVTGTKTVKDDDGNETTEEIIGYAETEKVYLDRVYAEENLVDEEQIMARFGDLVSQAEAEVVFDPSEHEAAPKVKKPKKIHRTTAEQILEQAGEEALAMVASKLAEELDIEVEATVDSVAMALQTRENRRDVVSELLNA